MNNSPANPFRPPAATTEVPRQNSREHISRSIISDGILAAVIAWAPINVALALLLVWAMPTVVLSAIDGTWQTSHGFSLWCVAPAISCCLVFHFHQRRAARMASSTQTTQ